MSKNNQIQRPPRLCRAWGYAIALVGTVMMTLVCLLTETDVQIATLGGLLSILVGLFVAHSQEFQQAERQRSELLECLQIPFTLAPVPGFFRHYDVFATAMAQLAKQPDPVLREFALMKLEAISDEVQAMAKGTVVFTATETWRAVYQKLLESLHVKAYYSVAWVKTGGYWNDPPGQQSMRLNYDLVARGFRIERVLILPDELWPFEERLPSAEIRPWIEQQHEGGIRVSLVREADLIDEPDLLQDFGIYGDKAVGIQELDDRSRTIRFILDFDATNLWKALNRWERLTLFTTKYSETLDQVPPE